MAFGLGAELSSSYEPLKSADCDYQKEAEQEERQRRQESNEPLMLHATKNTPNANEYRTKYRPPPDGAETVSAPVSATSGGCTATLTNGFDLQHGGFAIRVS